MSTVYKYPIDIIGDRFQMRFHAGAEILSVQIQGGVPTFWALVDSEYLQIGDPVSGYPSESVKTILVAGAGHERQDLRGARFIGTVQMHDGRLVLHFFEAQP